MTTLSEARPVCVLPRLRAEAREPEPFECCISITNPRQSPAKLPERISSVLRLGFHDADRPGGNFSLMSMTQAAAVLEFVQRHPRAPLTVHCEFGASRSVAVGLFLAVWLRRPLELTVDVLAPNPWVLRQLRLVALWHSLHWQDWRLLYVALRGPLALRYEVLPMTVADTCASV